MRFRFPLTLMAVACVQLSMAQQNFQLVDQQLPNPDNEPLPVHPVPSERQLKWQETEFYAFFHYGMNTYTNREWGNGDEDEALFRPSQVPDPMQWLKACKAAGMKGGIAVVKHHDGFCLWPTSTTTHSISRAGNQNGRLTNIPRDFAHAARKLGMKYGFYVSPWDRNSIHYGTDRYVTDVFLKQCAELAEYGADQYEMWFDGANGGDGYYGGRKTTVKVNKTIYYDTPNLRDTVHKVCPDCVLWGEGGEARWIGNESGFAGETNWMMYDRQPGVDPQTKGMEQGWMWLPGESDAKATDAGWFWHAGEKMKSPERLFQMYLETVGRNATWILNCPPDSSGLLPDSTVSVLRQLGGLLRQRLGRDIARKAKVQASVTRQSGAHCTFKARNLTDGRKDTYWAAPDDDHQATLTLTWAKPQTVRYVQLMEYIRLGQRVKAFSVEVTTDGQHWVPCATNVGMTTIGYKRIIPLNGDTRNSYDQGVSIQGLRVNILDSRGCPTLSAISVF